MGYGYEGRVKFRCIAIHGKIDSIFRIWMDFYYTLDQSAVKCYLFSIILNKKQTMKEETSTTIFGENFGQVAWVVPDIETTVKYFQETMGVP